jgi:DnaJ-domain-containing protein 1
LRREQLAPDRRRKIASPVGPLEDGRVRDPARLRRELSRGELVRLLYRLGRQRASGVLTISVRAATRPEVFALRHGCAIHGDGELARRAIAARLARLAQDAVSLLFESGVTSVLPPGATHAAPLAGWARSHLEHQLDGALAEVLVRQLGDARLSLRPELAPEPTDESDRRMLAAMAQPRRLDQIWPLARTPRYRLLAFLHFLRAVDALEITGAATDHTAPRPPAPARGPESRRLAALRMLGVDATAEPDDVKRAYRRLARSLHPDLQPDADADRRRTLERRFAELTEAYEALL